MSFFFIEFSNDHFTPQPWKVVDEKLAVAMVGFVHEGTRSETYERGGYFWTDFGLVLYL